MEQRLPDFVLAGLYKNSLVITEDAISLANTLTKDGTSPVEKPLPAAPAAPPKQWYLGNNGKHIAIIVNDAGAVYLNDESLQFLSSILSACKLNLGDVAIINRHQEPVLFSFLKSHLQPVVLLAFDVNLQQLQLPFTIPHYQVQPYDQCQFLSAPSLQTMLGESKEAKLEKTKLWLSLKKIFQL